MSITAEMHPTAEDAVGRFILQHSDVVARFDHWLAEHHPNVAVDEVRVRQTPSTGVPAHQATHELFLLPSWEQFGTLPKDHYCHYGKPEWRGGDHLLHVMRYVGWKPGTLEHTMENCAKAQHPAVTTWDTLEEIVSAEIARVKERGTLNLLDQVITSSRLRNRPGRVDDVTRDFIQKTREEIGDINGGSPLCACMIAAATYTYVTCGMKPYLPPPTISRWRQEIY